MREMIDGRHFMLGLGAVLAVAALVAMTVANRDDKEATASAAGANSAAAVAFQCDLNVFLAEHVALAASATGSALGGRTGEYEAAVKSLDSNSVDLAAAVGSVYGPDAEAAFLEGWRRHIGFFVDYTQGAAAKDQTKKTKAIADLHQYAIDVATLFNAANGLDKNAVIAIVDEHVKTLTNAIDAQAAGNATAAYEALRISIDHMGNLAGPLATATIAKFPEKFAVTEP